MLVIGEGSWKQPFILGCMLPRNRDDSKTWSLESERNEAGLELSLEKKQLSNMLARERGFGYFVVTYSSFSFPCVHM